MANNKDSSNWDRLQVLLESLQPGDEVHIAAASRETGLPAHTCEHVLDALSRKDLFTRLGEHTFVRCRISQPTEKAIV